MSVPHGRAPLSSFKFTWFLPILVCIRPRTRTNVMVKMHTQHHLHPSPESNPQELLLPQKRGQGATSSRWNKFTFMSAESVSKKLKNPALENKVGLLMSYFQLLVDLNRVLSPFSKQTTDSLCTADKSNLRAYTYPDQSSRSIQWKTSVNRMQINSVIRRPFMTEAAIP